MATSSFENHLQECRDALLEQRRSLEAELVALDKAIEDARTRKIKITCDSVPEDRLELGLQGNSISSQSRPLGAAPG